MGERDEMSPIAVFNITGTESPDSITREFLLFADI
jgi:hypothetical protein